MADYFMGNVVQPLTAPLRSQLVVRDVFSVKIPHRVGFFSYAVIVTADDPNAYLNLTQYNSWGLFMRANIGHGRVRIPWSISMTGVPLNQDVIFYFLLTGDKYTTYLAQWASITG